MQFQILLHDKTAHGVTDDHWLEGKTMGDRADVLDIVSDRTGAQRLLSMAASMASKAQRHSAIAFVGKETQEMFIPTPCGMPGPMDEQQRGRVSRTDAPLVDHLKHAAHGW